jgi:hypothetical protein
MTRMRRHLSPALVISIIALIGAWGGPAVARALIDSKDVKDRSLQGRDVASSTITSRNVTGLRGSDIIPDSLEGSDINERTLNIPKVPLAEAADKVAGVKIERFAYDDPFGRSAVFYDAGGIRVTGFCNSGVLEISVVGVSNDGIVRSEVAAPGVAPIIQADNDFDENDQLSLLPADLNDMTGSLTYYETGGATLLIQYLAASALPESTGHQCLLGGVAIRTDG